MESTVVLYAKAYEYVSETQLNSARLAVGLSWVELSRDVSVDMHSALFGTLHSADAFEPPSGTVRYTHRVGRLIWRYRCLNLITTQARTNSRCNRQSCNKRIAGYIEDATMGSMMSNRAGNNWSVGRDLISGPSIDRHIINSVILFLRRVELDLTIYDDMLMIW